jgi:hypothetical protein
MTVPGRLRMNSGPRSRASYSVRSSSACLDERLACGRGPLHSILTTARAALIEGYSKSFLGVWDAEIERVHGDGNLHPFAAVSDDRQHGVPRSPHGIDKGMGLGSREK